MAYDEKLAARIRQVLGASRGITETQMFGGLCFLLNGKMICGVLKNDMIAKIGKDNHEKVIALKHVRAFDFTGKPMKGIVYVGPAALRTSKDIAKWVDMGREHVTHLAHRRRKQGADRRP